MLVLCLMLSMTHYTQNYAGIIGGSLISAAKAHCLILLMKLKFLIMVTRLQNLENKPFAALLFNIKNFNFIQL